MSYTTDRPELSPEEKKLPLAKYYELSLTPPGPLQQQIIDYGCPIDPHKAIRPENFLDHLMIEGYAEQEYGYCMLEDGTGYLAVYTTYQNCTPQMLGWWFRWLNVHSKNMPEGKGNIKYKIWCPADHWDHYFLHENGYTDRRGGIATIEALDLGGGQDKFYTVRHYVDLKECGLSDEKEKTLQEAGSWVDSAVETFNTWPDMGPMPGSHLMLTQSRMSPLGFMEKRTREWLGWTIENGKPVRDWDTPADMLCEEYMKMVITHATVEAQQLAKFLPELYAEYKDKPDDAD